MSCSFFIWCLECFATLSTSLAFWGDFDKCQLSCRSTLFGPTCDGLDTIVREHPLPFLRNGDWIVFPNMGAYSIAGAVNFNGFHVADAPFFYICSEA